MEIQVNSDKNVLVDSQVIRFIGAEVNRVLKRFAGRLTRVEVHLSDVNSHKFRTNDKRCLIEARPARHLPLTASSQAPTVREALRGTSRKCGTHSKPCPIVWAGCTKIAPKTVARKREFAAH